MTYTVQGFKSNELVVTLENVEAKNVNIVKDIMHVIDEIDYFCASTKDGCIVYEGELAPFQK